MSIDSRTCDTARIARFLRREFSEQEHDALAEHLNGCPACSTSLQSQTAGANWWQAAMEFLADDPWELEPLSHPANPGDPAAPSLAVRQVLDHLAPTDDPRMLGRIGGYEVLGVVGSGGMGVVLKALDPALNRYVAIKTLSPTLAASGAARQRFAREARAAAAVVHDNVSEIYGVAEMGGLPYLVMPYVRGQSLQRRLDECGPLAVAEILRIGMQTAAGLAAAHAQGLVHRDIKPANILLSEGIERVQITDFGLARAADDASLTHSGMIAGTPQYMSPEQARGESVDLRSDLFSLGSVLYAMCTGRAPFRAETSYGVLRRITDSQPRPIRELNPEIPVWMCRLIGKLHAASPEDRYESAEEVAELLGRCLAHVQQPDAHSLPEELAATTRRPFRFHSTRLHGVLIMIATLGIGLLGMFLWQQTSPPEISGRWRGDQWGLVTLTQLQPDKYSGTYSDTFDNQPGEIELKWSRIERRFNGTWREGKDRSGEISVRLVGDEVRGAWTTHGNARIEPARPRLADLLWTRAAGETVREELLKPTAAAPAAVGSAREGAARELHVVCIYEGNPRTGAAIHGERATVRVERPGKRVVLFLSAYNSVSWDIAAGKETTVESVILGGHRKQALRQAPADTKVEEAFASDRTGLSGYYRLDTSAMHRLIRQLTERTELPVSSYSGVYRPEGEIVVSQVQNDPRLDVEFPRVNSDLPIPDASFQAAHVVGGRFPFGGTTSLGEYTLRGPKLETMRPFKGNFSRFAYDPMVRPRQRAVHLGPGRSIRDGASVHGAAEAEPSMRFGAGFETPEAAGRYAGRRGLLVQLFSG